MLSGVATYDRVPTSSTGLSYGGTISRPIRGATVETRSASGTTVWAQTTTDSNGRFTVAGPANASILIVVKATLGPNVPDTLIVDNTAKDAVYSIYVAKTTGNTAESGIAIHAASGWGGSGYTGTRAAAPFAILDTIYQGQQLLRSANPSIVFPLAVVGWSVGNDSARIGTSHYAPDTKRMAILGKADEDTDEFDDHVIAHEWGHWFEANFSRSDSIGGPHGEGDILDETVAFGEGWGNAFSGMVTSDPLYVDTNGPGQGNVGVAMNLDMDTSTDGAWSESSVQEILWDIFDGTAGIPDADSDGLALGFAPMYRVFTGAQKTTSAFTTIYSFLYNLKLQQPGYAANIALLETLENISAHDEYEETAAGLRRYTTLTTDGIAITQDVDGDPLQTYVRFGPISAQYFGNKLYNRLFFKATIGTAGTYRLRVDPVQAGGDVIIFRGGGRSPASVDVVSGGAEFLDFTAAAGETVTFAVGSFANAAFPDGQTPFTVRLGTVGAVPPVPRSNG